MRPIQVQKFNKKFNNSPLVVDTCLVVVEVVVEVVGEVFGSVEVVDFTVGMVQNLLAVDGDNFRYFRKQVFLQKDFINFALVRHPLSESRAKCAQVSSLKRFRQSPLPEILPGIRK